ncbi:cell division protein FtsQ/DivIB [Quadrisphaera sp. DSM 44207]|uniref:cell division protein FtsQ/DivIB n=1 Tax=Quadrisphaera sp. DSM 44207 TaxID=1881057 RepID=UPI000884D7F5|nr:FtsQ-type POTRA domain-containing protein [Quadrisphaera sp. DSM 44207]SDQ53503.1 cell division protein FtsQ [Quadrisphaera sp. DSM 44207]
MTRRPAAPVPRRAPADPRARERAAAARPASERPAPERPAPERPAPERPAPEPPPPREPLPPAPEPRAAGPRAVRRRRRRPGTRSVVAVLSVLALVGALVWVLLGTPVTALREVVVTGTARTDPAAVEAAAQSQLGRPLLRVDEDAVRAGTADLPFVADLQVHRRWLHGVELVVTERVAVAAVQADGGYDVLDAAGDVITTGPGLLEDVPLVDVDVAAAGTGALRAAGEVARGLPGELRAEVARVSASSADDVRLDLRDGATVRWGSAEAPELKADVLLVLRERRAQAYDVSAPAAPATSGEAPQPSSDAP